MRLFNRVAYVIILSALAIAQDRSTRRKPPCEEAGAEIHPVGPSRVIQRCQAGPPGVKGEKGEPGIIDVALLKQEIIEEVIEKLQFDTTIAEINSKLMKLQRKTGDVICQGVNKISHNGKCYWLILHSGQDISFSRAQRLCEGEGGDPADILDESHYNKTERLIQATTLSSIQWVYVWTGTAINPHTKVMTMCGGENTTYAKWLNEGWPKSNTLFTRVVLQIYKDSKVKNGMWNYDPTWPAHGVLCKK